MHGGHMTVKYNNTCKTEASFVIMFTLYVLVKYVSGDGRDAERCTKIM